jgi:hypothetical protein
MNTIKLMGSVALLADRPEVALLRGDVGTVSELVEKTEHHPGSCVVEFLDDLGNVFMLLNVTDNSELMPLRMRLTPR